MIELKNVSKNYGTHCVLRDLSLRIPAGRIVGLLGGNGAGKTTTLNLILGFLKPDSGSIQVKGQTAYISENVALYPELTGRENLQIFSAYAGRELSDDDASKLLARVGMMPDAGNRRLSSYSKGMRQRVAIAIALAKQANIFLLDEPTTGLDPSALRELAQLLRELAVDGASILLTTHDLWHLSMDSDEVAILRDGVLVDQFEIAGFGVSELSERYMATQR